MYMIKTGIIYKIICKLDDSFCYIGSTYNVLSQRWRQHVKDYNKWKNNKKYYVSIYPYFLKHGVNNFKIIEIKKYRVCAANSRDKSHLSVYELLHILKHKNCVNQVFPFNPLHKLTKQDYNKKFYINNKKKINQQQADYYKKNKIKILERRKFHKFSCKCGSVIRKCDLNVHIKSKKHEDYINNLNNNN